MTEREYNECVTNYADNVYRFVFKNLQHEADARDVVQNAFEKMWVNRDAVRNETSKSFLFTVAYNQMIDHIRKHKRVVLHDDMGLVNMQQTQQPNNTARLLKEALSQLPETQRSLVMLKDYEGYNYAEIGEITGLHASQVKVYLHRARLALKAYIVKMENIL